MYCCRRMIKVVYYPNKWRKIEAYWCTRCGELRTTHGLRIWRGKIGA